MLVNSRVHVTSQEWRLVSKLTIHTSFLIGVCFYHRGCCLPIKLYSKRLLSINRAWTLFQALNPRTFKGFWALYSITLKDVSTKDNGLRWSSLDEQISIKLSHSKEKPSSLDFVSWSPWKSKGCTLEHCYPQLNPVEFGCYEAPAISN